MLLEEGGMHMSLLYSNPHPITTDLTDVKKQVPYC